MDLGDLAAGLHTELDAKTARRERALAGSRSSVRACGNAIRALHRHELDLSTSLLEEAEGNLREAREALVDHADMLHAGFVHDAEKELAEARITFALITNGAFPTPDGLGIASSAFLKGLAEAIGELRRHVLDLMRQGRLERCEELLGDMDDIYYLLVSMDYPDGITFGLRRLTDIARSILERTRGDFTTSMSQSALKAALEKHTHSLEAR